ncbi:MAG: hypothetical protein AAF570_17355, partial [Bacteroidota bacterium]
MKQLKLFALVCVLLFGLSGCGGVDDKEGILGIWRLKLSTVRGGLVGDDGKSWFHFKKDGVVDTRPRPAAYESGKYSLTHMTK